MTDYYACPECDRIFDYEEPCHFPEDLVVIHERQDGNHWFEVTSGEIKRNWLVKREPKPPVAEPTPTRRWEYCVVQVEAGMNSVLNDQGKQGWELVSLVLNSASPNFWLFAYMKREVTFNQ